MKISLSLSHTHIFIYRGARQTDRQGREREMETERDRETERERERDGSTDHVQRAKYRSQAHINSSPSLFSSFFGVTWPTNIMFCIAVAICQDSVGTTC